MGTPCYVVYNAFQAKELDDEWINWDPQLVDMDMRSLLDAALMHFKFPRVSLEIENGEPGDPDNRDAFVEELSNREIQILAQYMKCEWLDRSILTWENVKPLYDERDFSPANLLDKLNQLSQTHHKYAQKLEGYYYRSIDNKPFDYTRLAGNNN